MRRKGDARPPLFTAAQNGCDFYADCLTCPLVVCRYDVKGGLPQAILMTPTIDLPDEVAKWARPAKILVLHRRGWKPPAIAKKVGCGTRSVYRVLAGQRKVP